jgi:hypothetical protein
MTAVSMRRSSTQGDDRRPPPLRRLPPAIYWRWHPCFIQARLAHEDHPQRALYAALRMQEEMRQYSRKLRQAGNLPMEDRVGLNTGEVVIGSIATSEAHDEYMPIGHSISLAARMQALAPTGSITATDAINTRQCKRAGVRDHEPAPTMTNRRPASQPSRLRFCRLDSRLSGMSPATIVQGDRQIFRLDAQRVRD